MQGTELYSRRARVPRMARAFVGLGSNLGDREANLRGAVEELRRLRGTTVRAVSSFRDTAPVGIVDQPRFLNGAVELETELSPRALLDALLAIERSFGRDRDGVPAGGPRTLDLDLLIYGEAEIREPGLVVPHPRLAERAFVLEPLAELDPALEVPAKGRVEALLAKLHSAA
jgi:2-amino-4-hydroxy-6-hydroxymethyldihydropteridine diphosphokinase